MELRLRYKTEKVRWSDETAILDCISDTGSHVSVIVDCEKGELDQGCQYIFSGDFKHHKRYGQQFKADSFVLDTPVTKLATVMYLQRFYGIGEVRAENIWNAFKEKTLETIAETPLVLCDYGVSAKIAQQVSSQVVHDLASAKVELELTAMLAGSRMPKKARKDFYKDHGARSVKILKSNPYLLLKYDGCGFNLVDQFALERGFPKNRLKRQALCLLDAMKNTEHTWYAASELESVILKIFGNEGDFRKTIRLLVRAKKIVGVKRDGVWFAMREDADDENIISAEIRKHLVENFPVEIDFSSLSESQRNALGNAVKLRIGCFTGGPGTGKTYSVSRYIDSIVRKYGSNEIVVLAPTGKAVVRSREMLASIGVSCESKTIHSFLGTVALGSIPRFVIVDEASMIDASLMRRLLVACPTSSFLFVGDDGQLLPVGKGRPFADFLASGLVPVGRLTETRRNSGMIVDVCHKIRAGASWSCGGNIDVSSGENLALVRSANFLNSVRDIIHGLKDYDPIRDVQVICGVNKGENGVHEMNVALKGELNPSDARYAVGDPVICLKNGFYAGMDSEDTEDDSGSVYVSNGEIGYVFKVHGTKIFVDYGENRQVRFRVNNLKFSLAYAVTCHKMQGSETPVAIVILDPSFGAGMVCKREWLYTAISRAKKECYLVGDMGTAVKFGRAVAAGRKTFLKEILK